MLKILRLLIIVLVLPLSVFSQEGTPFITHYEGNRNQDMQNWAICQDSRDVMYFANRHGLLSYDGYRWENIKLPNTPMTIARDEISDRIYIGALNNFGYLQKDSKGDIEYISLSNDSISIGLITGIQFEEESIMFFGDESVSLYSRDEEKVSGLWFAENEELFTGVVYINDRLFINVSARGLHRIDSDTLFPIVTGYLTNDSEVLFTLPHSDGKVLMGTSDNRLSLFDGIKYYDYPLSNQDYLMENLLSDGVVVGEKYYAFSTLYGGAIVVDKYGGNIVHTINYQNGLPDDEIYAIGSDNNDGLWLAHSYGVSRIDLRLPIENYSGFPGLEGVITASVQYNDRLYIATNTGLYILDEVKNYTEVEEFYRVNQAVRSQDPLTERKSESATGSQEQEEKEKTPLKKVFSRLFSKKTEAEVKEETKTEVADPEPVVTKPVYRKRTVSKLQSIDWIYRKIDGINSRCNSIIPTEHGLIVASGSGLFSVSGLEATMIDNDRTINAIASVNSDLIVASEFGLYSTSFTNGSWNVDRSKFNHKTPVYSVTKDKNGAIWAGGNNVIYRFEEIENSRFGETGWYYYDSEFQENCMIDYVNDTVMLFAESGIEYYSPDDDLFYPYIKTRQLKNGATVMRYILNQPGSPWIYDGSEWYTISLPIRVKEPITKIFRLFDDITAITFTDFGECWVIDDRKGIYRIESIEESESDPRFNLFISRIYNDEGTFFDFENLVFEPGEKAINLKLSAPHFIKATSTQYQYLIEDMMRTWSVWSYNPDINLFLPSGDYTIRLRARNILGKVSDERTISFSIKPPFTKTAWFFILMGISAIALIWLFTDLRQRKLRHDKKILEVKVKERTIELEKKRTQIEEQRDEIFRQKEEITSSITYARRIQEALLPANELLKKSFTDQFVLFKPRDIVSGDFYWIAESRSFIYFAVADCTGHGVPGAFMSMLGISLLNEITGEGAIDLPTDEILNILRDKIISALHQEGKDEQSSDGMDISLCKYKRKDKTLEFSGAFNPLFHYRNNKLIEYKADRQPIGFFEKSKKFSMEKVSIKKGDTIYLFSDGYYDQFGGPNDKRYSSKKLKSTLTGIVDMPLNKQLDQLEENFQLWKGEQEQVDDVIILGVRF